MHICINKITLIGSDNGLFPCRCQAIIRTNTGILLIWPLETNFSEISIKIHISSFSKMYLKMSSAKWWPFCFSLNVLGRFPLKEGQNTTVLHSQYHGCWCTGNTRSQGISRYGTDLVSLEYSSHEKEWLTHWGWEKMAAIFQTTFSNALAWMKIIVFWCKFRWNLFPRVQLTIV